MAWYAALGILIAVLIVIAFWLIGPIGPRRSADDSGMPQPRFSVSARLKSFAHAFDGLRTLIRQEHNARIHLIATVCVVAAGFAIGLDGSDWRWIILAIGWVWFAEAMNAAFEYLCDVVSPDANDTVRIAKDVAAAAVLISAVGAAVIGAIILTPYAAAALDRYGIDLGRF
ncbi:MAG: diacylglycerol kinase family protein [Alphaproteobacteria bacterium]|nr:diacylglycerol kinase family protein [Alphaproteobacteria bacterium]